MDDIHETQRRENDAPPLESEVQTEQGQSQSERGSSPDTGCSGSKSSQGGPATEREDSAEEDSSAPESGIPMSQGVLVRGSSVQVGDSRAARSAASKKESTKAGFPHREVTHPESSAQSSPAGSAPVECSDASDTRGAGSVQCRPLPKPPIPLQNKKELTAINAISKDRAYLQFDRPTATRVGGGETVRPPTEDTNELICSPTINVGGVTSRALEAGKDIANIGVEHSVQIPLAGASLVADCKKESDHEAEGLYENIYVDPNTQSTVSSDLPSNNSSEYDYPIQDGPRRIQVHEDVSVRVSGSWDPRLTMGARNLVLVIDNDTDGRLDYRPLRYFLEDLLSASGINPAVAETVLGCRCQFTGKTSKEKGDAVEELLRTCYQSGRRSWNQIKFNAHMKMLLTSWKGLQVLQEALEQQ